ncbi:sulfotransferase [Gloeocapsopsis crepidinum LEGE 06123]|uniref:Sulfotransferase n=1 Tax=Gloeocapsopsis crepidinum LEGE 06123 TaxID=588587 RepID=A0ABR9UT58_9CHRO|nr:sulfotransferase [Gloeocapsopsis crepidinum]MBE9190538.1 sulfotransferase [Gloeocapsopsis crepidinum LEGE 06123]
MSKPRPNLFVIGAMKAGTSSLHNYLNNHPQIFMCSPKEPMFFSNHSNWEKGEQEYLKLFENAGDALLVGESSTNYSKAPYYSGVPELIAQFNPDARFIYIMRDPIERTISHYWFHVSYFKERRDIVTAIQQQPHYLEVSDYAMQLKLYFDAFGKERVATLTLEDLKKDATKEMQKLFAWLGVDSSFVPQNLEERKNVTPRKVLWQEKSLAGSLRNSKYWQAVKPIVPKSMRTWAKSWSNTYVDREVVDLEPVKAFLRPIQVKQVETLSELLGRQFPEWKTLYAS